MAQGLEVYDEKSRLINTTNVRMPRIMGSFVITGNTTGSQAISGIPSEATPIFFVRQMSNRYLDNMPYVEMSRTSISWKYRRFGPEWSGNTWADCLVQWGYY